MVERIVPPANTPSGDRRQVAEAAPRRRLRGLLVISALFLISLFTLPAAHAGGQPTPSIAVILIPSPLNPNGDDPVQNLRLFPVEQAVLITVVDEFFIPIPDAQVAVTVTGSNAQPGPVIVATDENGEAVVTYAALLPGTDTITAQLVADPTVQASVEKQWTVPPLVGPPVLQASASGVLRSGLGSRWPFFATATFRRGAVGGSAGFKLGAQERFPALLFTVPPRPGFGVTGMMSQNGVIVLFGRGLAYESTRPRNPRVVDFRIQFVRIQGNQGLVSILLNTPDGPLFELNNAILEQAVISIRAR